jgi:hypothetical protein
MQISLTRHKSLVFTCSLLSGVLIAAVLACQVSARPIYARDTSCQQIVDPITVLFYGSGALLRRLASNPESATPHGHVEYHTDWTFHSDENAQGIQDGGCELAEAKHQVASESGGGNDRYHMRMWQLDGLDDKGRHNTVGTPHHEDWVDWNPISAPGCGTGPFTGKHAVDKGEYDPTSPNGSTTPEGSGFDKARRKVARLFNNPRQAHDVSYHRWPNTRSVIQCDEDPAASNGIVAWISMGRH